MKKFFFALATLAIFAQFGCIGFVIDMLKSDTDNLVLQKDFMPDPFFGYKRCGTVNPASPLTAKDIAKIPGVIWLEMMGTADRAVSNASGFMVRFAGKPHVASAGHICKGPEYKAIFAYFSEGRAKPEELEIVACDEDLDVCLLRFKNQNFKYENYPPLGTSASLSKGAKVFTHGTPLGYDFSQSEGLVSKLDFGLIHAGVKQPQMIHHSAKINPGDSGGPLFNEYGSVVGMNVMGYGGGRGNTTTIYGAIPIDDIITVFRNLKESGYVKHPSIGWRLYPTSRLNPLDYKHEKLEQPGLDGLLVRSVIAGGAADKAGIKVCDILLEYDGRKPENYQEVARYILFKKNPGDEIEVKVYRETRWTEDRLEKDKDGNSVFNHYPRMKTEELELKAKLE